MSDKTTNNFMEKWSMSCSEYASRQLRRYEEITNNFKNKFKHYYNKRQTLNIKMREDNKKEKERLRSEDHNIHEKRAGQRNSAKSQHSKSRAESGTPSRKGHQRDSMISSKTKTTNKNTAHHKINYNIHEKTCHSKEYVSNKKKPPIPFSQSYMENEVEVEKRINDLTKMLKEKIEQI